MRFRALAFSEAFEYILRRRNLLALAVNQWLGKAHVRECNKNFAELLGRIDVEATAGVFVDEFAHPLNLSPEAL